MDSESSASDEEFSNVKIVMVGNSGVGKSCIVRRFCVNAFSEVYKPTAGVDFYNKKFVIPNSQTTVSLRVWDVGGKQLERKMLDHYLENCDAICCVYDLTSRSSLENVQTWKECIGRVFQDKEVPCMVLVGNKSDVLQKEVSQSEHAETAKEYDMKSALVSAATGEKVAAMFTSIAAELAGVRLNDTGLEIAEEATVRVENPPVKHSKRQKLHSTSTTQKSKKSGCLIM